MRHTVTFHGEPRYATLADVPRPASLKLSRARDLRIAYLAARRLADLRALSELAGISTSTAQRLVEGQAPYDRLMTETPPAEVWLVWRPVGDAGTAPSGSVCLGTVMPDGPPFV